MIIVFRVGKDLTALNPVTYLYFIDGVILELKRCQHLVIKKLWSHALKIWIPSHHLRPEANATSSRKFADMSYQKRSDRLWYFGDSIPRALTVPS